MISNKRALKLSNLLISYRNIVKSVWWNGLRSDGLRNREMVGENTLNVCYIKRTENDRCYVFDIYIYIYSSNCRPARFHI